MHHQWLMGVSIFRKKGLRVVAVLVLLAGAIMARAWLVRDTPSDDVYIAKPLYSPDGKYMAVVFSENGGGAISPYCFNDVSVVPASLKPVQAYARRFRVYEGGCHTLGFFYPVHSRPALLNAPLLKWSGPRELEITIDPTQAALGVNEVLFAGHSDDGLVQITQKSFNKKHARVAGPFIAYKLPDILD
jgi:hypothetical protein